MPPQAEQHHYPHPLEADSPLSEWDAFDRVVDDMMMMQDEAIVQSAQPDLNHQEEEHGKYSPLFSAGIQHDGPHEMNRISVLAQEEMRLSLTIKRTRKRAQNKKRRKSGGGTRPGEDRPPKRALNAYNLFFGTSETRF